MDIYFTISASPVNLAHAVVVGWEQCLSVIHAEFLNEGEQMYLHQNMPFTMTIVADSKIRLPEDENVAHISSKHLTFCYVSRSVSR